MLARPTLPVRPWCATEFVSKAKEGAPAACKQLRASAQHISEELRTHQHDIVFAVLVSFFAARQNRVLLSASFRS